MQKVLFQHRTRPELRPYQEEFLKKIERLYHSGVSRLLLVAATGLGKTIAFAFLPQYFPMLAKYGMLVLVHRRELVEQAADKIKWAWPELTVQIEMADRGAVRHADVVVASVQTLGRAGSRRLRKFAGRFGIIVVDEAHHLSKGSQYERVLDFFGVGPNIEADNTLISGHRRLLIGVTATPNRHDGQGLHLFFDDIAANLDIRWGVENGYLVDIVAHKVTTSTDLSGISTRAGDFALNELSGAINIRERNDEIVKGFVEQGGKKAIAFCADISHAVELTNTFGDFGIEAHAVHSGNKNFEMEQYERIELVEAFRNDRFPVLCNVGIATEGFDAPSVDTILMARPTKSQPLYIQMLGRGTRPSFNPTQETAAERVAAIEQSDKPAMHVIDFTDNAGKHSIITTPRLFGLEQDFDAKSKSIIAAVKTVEALEAEHPGKNLRKAKSLEEIKIVAERISIWDVAETPESVQDITGLHWMEVANDVFQIHVPGSLDNSVISNGAEKRDFFIRLEPDRLGRYQATVIKTPVWEDGQLIHPKSVAKSDRIHNSKEEAITAVDRYLESAYGGVTNLISRGAKWEKRPATEKQIQYLKRLKVYIPENHTLDRGQASRLIAAAKGQKAA